MPKQENVLTRRWTFLFLKSKNESLCFPLPSLSFWLTAALLVETLPASAEKCRASPDLGGCWKGVRRHRRQMLAPEPGTLRAYRKTCCLGKTSLLLTGRKIKFFLSDRFEKHKEERFWGLGLHSPTWTNIFQWYFLVQMAVSFAPRVHCTHLPLVMLLAHSCFFCLSLADLGAFSHQ